MPYSRTGTDIRSLGTNCQRDCGSGAVQRLVHFFCRKFIQGIVRQHLFLIPCSRFRGSAVAAARQRQPKGQRQQQAKQPPVKDDVSEVIDFLKKTCSAEFEQKLDMLTRVIFQARHIFFVGSGMSGIVAKYGARYFSSMGKFCLYIDEPHYPTESRFVENSLVIVFSVSGESRDTIGHVMRFKEQNCQILSVTNTENCTIAKLSDYNLAYYVTYERLGVYDVTTQLPAMSIVERLGKKLYRYTSEGPAAI